MKLLNIILTLCVLIFITACHEPERQLTQVTARPIEIPKPVEIEIEYLDASIEIIADSVIYFAYNMYNVDVQYAEILQQHATLLDVFPDVHLRIEGNCDSRGTHEYNLALGERRARAVQDYLILLGVNPEQLTIVSYGKERPVMAGRSEAAHSANRRANFTIIDYGTSRNMKVEVEVQQDVWQDTKTWQEETWGVSEDTWTDEQEWQKVQQEEWQE